MTLSVFVNCLPAATRIAVTQKGRLIHWNVHLPGATPALGSLFLARVKQWHPGMKAAFLDLGQEDPAFLDSRDLPKSLQDPAPVLKEGQSLIVQVKKPAYGKKLIQVTANIKLLGFHVVLLPDQSGIFFSRRFKGDQDKWKRQFTWIDNQKPSYGLIVRSSAGEVEPAQVEAEIRYMAQRLHKATKSGDQGKNRPLLIEDPVLTCLKEFDRQGINNIFVDNHTTYQQIRDTLAATNPPLLSALKCHAGETPLFDVYKIESAIDASRAARVWLKSGGWLDIGQTEAMVTIDVNSGKGRKGKQGMSAALTTNLEAAQELANQLRLRNLSGLIAVDFINAPDAGWQKICDRALAKSLRQDPLPVDLLPINRLGLAQLSRSRQFAGADDLLSQPCDRCGGRGRMPSLQGTLIEIQKITLRDAPGLEGDVLTFICGRDLAAHLKQNHGLLFQAAQDHFGMEVRIRTKATLPPLGFKVELGP